MRLMGFRSALDAYHGRIWLDDKPFFRYFRKYVGTDFDTADRRFFLRSILPLVDGLPGDTAECGVYRGASSWLICEHFKNSEKTHYIFDSFRGLSEPTQEDGKYWVKGAFRASESLVRRRLSLYRVVICKGWIPDRFEEISAQRFCFVHIDVDLYQPTLRFRVLL